MPIPRKKVIVRLEREDHGGDTYDVLYIDDKEIATFHIQNIDSLKLVHNNETILKFITDYLNNGQ
jgi:hypothetical protein